MAKEESIPSNKQELLEYFQSLSYEELSSIYKMSLPNDSGPELIDELENYQDSSQPATTDICAKKLKSSGRKSKSIVERSIESVDITRICPFCNNSTIYKHGIRKGLQRYRCTTCGTVFTPNTNTVMSYSHKPSKVWHKVITDTVNGVSIEETARLLSINNHTIFNMRHKILLAMAKIEDDSPTVLGEITELDETYVLESKKGTKLEDDSDRNARKRGGKATKRGLSNEQVCLFAGVQRDGAAYMHCVNYGRPSKKEIEEVFDGHITDDSMYMTDGMKGYSVLSEMKSSQVVNTKDENSSFYHINNVNNLHSQFKGRYEDYRGVATKYINRYLILMSRIYKSKDKIVEAIWNIICEMNTVSYSFTGRDVKEQDLCTPSE